MYDSKLTPHEQKSVCTVLSNESLTTATTSAATSTLSRHDDDGRSMEVSIGHVGDTQLGNPMSMMNDSSNTFAAMLSGATINTLNFNIYPK